MAIRTYKVTLDSKNSIAPEPVFLRQGDKTGAVVINATLMDNGSPVSLSGLTPMFKANTADGQAVIADSTGFNIVNASGGEFTYQVPSQLGSVDGKIQIAYFSFSDSSGAQSTFNVVFVVEKAADMTQESAKDWVSNLNNIISQYNQWVNDAHYSWEYFVNFNKDILENIDPGGKILSKLADADPSAGKAALAYLNNDAVEVDGKRPSYYQRKLADMAGLIDGNKFNLALITDNHYQADMYAPHSLGHYANIAALSRIAPIDVIVSGGDNINGDHDRDQTLIETRQATSTLYYRAGLDTDVFFALGNHDTGAYQGSQGEDKTKPEYCISLDEIKDFYNSKTPLFGEVREDDSLYFYKDYPSKKIRLIVLNSFDLPETVNEDGTYKYDFLRDSAYRNAQLNWLANSALLLPSNDWQVVVFTHCPLPETFEVAAGQTVLSQFNSESLIKILNAFQAGTTLKINDDSGEFPVVLNADYTAQGKGIIISLISGHIHRDGQMNYRGINCIETACSLCYSGDLGRDKNTETEDLWDVYEIDSVNRSIRIMRFGAGNDRMYNY